MSSVDARQGTLHLGSSRLDVNYPASLGLWFEAARNSAPSPTRGRLAIDETSAGLFSVQVGGDEPLGRELSSGDALAIFWERAAYLLVDELGDAAAVHGAAAISDRLLLLIPGHTGAGKTRLSLWSRLHGFDVLTDEVVALALDEGKARVAGALPRPLILKQSDDAQGLLRPGERPMAEEPSVYGRLLQLERPFAGSHASPDRGLIIFPRFAAGAALTLSLLTPGEAAARLLESCLNVRNLTRGGLPILGAAANRWPAITLDYGATEQLEGRLDLLLGLFADNALSRARLGALCVALSQPTDAAPAPQPPPPAAALRPAPAETPTRFPRRLSIGMATFDDYDGVYFTIQAIRLNNPELCDAIEFVVIDNNPGGPCAEALSDLAKWIDGYRYVPRGDIHGTAVRNAVFQVASSPIVLCVDCHVLIAPGALTALLAHFDADPSCRDLVQGPLVYDDLKKISTHWQPAWRGGMLGTWAEDPRGQAADAPPFDIPLQGLGLFACRRDAWPGFNPMFRGFGGEEGYIHEKIRQRGGRTVCLPALRWVHRFGRPLGVPYRNRWEDRIRNYYIGFSELGLETGDMEEHFAELLGRDVAARILADIRREFSARRDVASGSSATS